MADYQGRKIVIVGLGITGLSCVDFFMAKGVVPKVIDSRSNPPGIDKLPAQVERWVGDINVQWLLDADLIVLSPGVAFISSCSQCRCGRGD